MGMIISILRLYSAVCCHTSVGFWLFIKCKGNAKASSYK